MCGFAVMFGLRGREADAGVVSRMSATLRHRGPDDEGLHVSGPAGFGFRRLSILDLSPAGHQPMVLPGAGHTLVFNGEIYNYVEVRRELEGRGRRFRSSGDSEVLLQAYDEWGTACVDRFNGMWAFAIYDAPRQRLVVSRDRFGVKPLFLYRADDCVLLGSEIKAIVASGLYRGGTNWAAAARYVRHGDLDVDTETFYAGIEHVEPGTIAEIGVDGGGRTRRFWSLDGIDRTPVASPTETFRTTFEDAVRIRMRSDVPVGVFLSGGIDSTSIICTMAALRQRGVRSAEPLNAFSYLSKEFDESAYIRDTLARTEASFEEVVINPRELWDALDKVLWHHDEPVHSATALVGYELMRRARQTGTIVILNGQGADETLAGYWNYVYAYWTELVLAGDLRRAWRELSRYCAEHNRPRMTAWREVSRRVAAVSGRMIAPALFKHERPSLVGGRWSTPDLDAHLRPRPSLSSAGLRDQLAASVTFKPLPIFLRVEDRNAMAHSVEARLPFMDYRLVRLAFALPSEWKVRAPWNKFVLREAMRGVIPESVRTRRDKMGFPTSAREWIASAWFEPMQDLFGSRSFRERGIFNVPELRRALIRHRAGSDYSTALFTAAQLELWCRRQGPSAATASTGVSRREGVAFDRGRKTLSEVEAGS